MSEVFVEPVRVPAEARRRRTFAVISHPDAGKSTLTEAFALYAEAIDVAGAVHGKAGRRGVTSDWMEMERKRGISITSAVLQFAYRDCVINLLDTPGHGDFSEDTYRVLAAVDAAVMLLDSAKGLEPQTLKLVDVAPAPEPRDDADGNARPLEAPTSGLVFKVQAGMDRAHRDRMAFVRICSGRFERGMVLTHAATGRPFATKYAQSMFGQDRETVEEAFPGDVIGLVNATALRPGDTLYAGEVPVEFPPIPSFAPE